MMTVTNIIAKYFDKRQATVQAIQDYDSMKFIVDNKKTELDLKIEEIDHNMGGVHSPTINDMPKIHNNNATEDRYIKGITDKDILTQRYNEAVEFLSWFEPAWNHLSEEDRYVLRTYYIDAAIIGQGEAIYDISDHFKVERSSAYNKKNRAIEKLQVLLFGKA
jgi:hypothetical protein